MRIPLFGTGVASGQKQVTVRKTVGMYWERRGETEKAPMVAVPWGDVQETQTTMAGDATDAVRFVTRDYSSDIGRLIVVAGKSVYRVLPNAPTSTKVGEVTGAATGLPRVAPGPGQTFLVVDGIGAWYWDGSTFHSIGEAFATCTWIGGYFVAAKAGDGGKFYISSDGVTWTDFATAEAAPDGIVALVASRNELFVLGASTTEVWSHTGDSDFPFARVNGATTNIGCMSQRTAVLVGGVLYFVARSEAGAPFVARMNGYTPERVSTDDIDSMIPDQYQVATAIDACGFVWSGHPIYMLSNSTPPSWTIHFDASTGLWGHVTDGDRHRIVLGVEYQGRIFGTNTLAGVVADRKLYQWPNDGTSKTRYPLPDRRIVTDHVVSPDGERFTVDSLRLDMATNMDAAEKSVSLKVSRDGGLSWGATQSVGLGTSSGPQKKVEFRRLGRSRSFTFDLSFPTDVPITVHSASLNASD